MFYYTCLVLCCLNKVRRFKFLYFFAGCSHLTHRNVENGTLQFCTLLVKLTHKPLIAFTTTRESFCKFKLLMMTTHLLMISLMSMACQHLELVMRWYVLRDTMERGAIFFNNCPTADVCRPNSACINGDNNYTYQCDPGYTGSACTTAIPTCVSVDCSGHGQCIAGDGSTTCKCDPGYTGVMCET